MKRHQSIKSVLVDTKIESFVSQANATEYKALIDAVLHARLPELVGYFQQIMITKRLCGNGKATFKQLTGMRSQKSEEKLEMRKKKQMKLRKALQFEEEEKDEEPDRSSSSESSSSRHSAAESDISQEWMGETTAQPRSPDAHREAQAFVDSKSLDNTVAPMIKFRLDELEHFVFMMFLYGTDGIADYTQNSPVFKGLQKSRIKRLQTAVLSVSSTQALQKLKGLNMFRFAVYHYVELQRLVQRGQAGGTKDSRVVNSYPMQDKRLQQMEVAKIESLFSDPPAEKLVFEAMAKRSLLSTQNLVRSVPVRIKLLPTNEALQYLDELAEQINRKMWERKLQKEQEERSILNHGQQLTMGQSKAEQFKAKMGLIEKKKKSSILHDQVFPSIQGLSIAFNIRKRDVKRVSKSLMKPMVEPVVNQAGLPRTKTAQPRAGGSALGPQLGPS